MFWTINRLNPIVKRTVFSRNRWTLFINAIKVITLFFLIISCTTKNIPNLKEQSISEYNKIQNNLAKGWNTWNTNNLLSHVLLPEGISIDLILKDEKSDQYLKKAIADREDKEIRLLAHSYDGSYSELTLFWNGIDIRVQSATTNEGADQVIQITPLNNFSNKAKLIVEPKILWGQEGMVTNSHNYLETAENDTIYAYLSTHRIEIYVRGTSVNDPYSSQNKYVSVVDLKSFVTVSTGTNRTQKEVAKIISKAKENLENSKKSFGSLKDVYDLVQTVLSWNIIYDPSHQRVISPVSREWSANGRGGYVLFCWDNYFAAYMFSAANKEMAYTNLIETTKIVDEVGFVPNHNGGNDISRDRSQPPIGSIVTKAVYKKYKEKWLLEEVFDRLLKWNRWWTIARDQDGYLCWGSDPYPGMEKSIYYSPGILRAKWESGLDNSPMYDDVTYNSDTHMMPLADVGLMSLYVADCNALSFLASEIGRTKESDELRIRGEKYRSKLNTLWDEKSGIYLNKHLDTGKLSHRLSPTNFYPLLANAPSYQQAERMINEHFYNPDEFWGNYIMASISRDDPAFTDNNYWRGRIWAPMNFLVYLGLLNYDLPQARADLVKKSEKLLMKEWLSRRYVFENYNAITGQGDDVSNSDNFYLWGGLLGFMQLVENGEASTCW